MSVRDVLQIYLVPSFGDREGAIVADEILAALHAAGFAVVPVEATSRMCAAGVPEVRKARGLQKGRGDMQTIWAAMIAAANPDSTPG
jgi:hypothetical protein